MYNIKRTSDENRLGKATKEWAIFELRYFEYYGYDYSDKAVILLNADGKFIIGRKFKNCISIGSGIIMEFDTFEEACNFIDNHDVERYIK